MKAISLWQPWASLWLSCAKMHETRHWPTTHRGPLIVHAAKKLVSACGEQLDEICLREFGTDWRLTLPRGALIGTVEIVACRPTQAVYSAEAFPGGLEAVDDYICGNFEPGRFAWQRGVYRVFETPIPFTGRQGFFDVAETLLAEAA